MKIKVYGLTASPDVAEVRYVGVTKHALERRLSGHLSRARSGEDTHKARWIRKTVAAGLQVRIVLLAEVPFDEWERWERHYIATIPNLTNATAGGEGLLNPSSETRERMRQAQTGKKRSPESIEKGRAAMLGNKHMLGKKLSTATRAKIGAAHQGRKRATMKRSAEGAERIRQAHLGNAYRRGATHTEQARAKMSAARTGLNRGPHKAETIAKMSAAAKGRTFSDETRLKMSEAAKRKSAPSDETRKRLSEAIRASWVARKLPVVGA